MMHFLKTIFMSLIVFAGSLLHTSFLHAEALKDFRATNQRLALIGSVYSGVETGIEKRLLQDFRKEINRYSRSFGEASVAQFTLAENTGGRFFAPAPEALSEEQKKFIKETCKANDFDIFVLSSLEAKSIDIVASLQLFDCRIDSLSPVETETFPLVGDAQKTAQYIYRLMDSLDRDGFVHSSRQGFLASPVVSVLSDTVISGAPLSADETALNPADLSPGHLAGSSVIGGDRRPFWEKPWFWGLIGGGLLVAGGLSYYFLVVNQPPTGANVRFQIP